MKPGVHDDVYTNHGGTEDTEWRSGPIFRTWPTHNASVISVPPWFVLPRRLQRSLSKAFAAKAANQRLMATAPAQKRAQPPASAEALRSAG